MIPFHKSIGFRILGISIILLAIPLLVDSFIFLENYFQFASMQARSRLLKEVDFRALPIQDIKRDNEEIFRLITYFLKLNTNFPAEASVELDGILKQLSLVNEYTGIVVAKHKEDGKFYTVATNLKRYSGSNANLIFDAVNPFINSSSSSGSMTGFMHNPENNTLYLLSVKPIYDQTNKGIGAIAIIYDIRQELNFLLTPTTAPYRIDYALLLPSEIILIASDPELRFHYFRELSSNERVHLQKVAPNATAFIPTNPLPIIEDPDGPFISFLWNDKKQIGALQPLADTDIAILAFAANASILAEPIWEFFRIYGTYLLVLLVGLIVAFFVTRRLEKPVLRLAEVMSGLEKGDLQKRYEHDPLGFEINRLGDTFNAMVDTLFEKERLIEAERIQKEILSKELMLGQVVQRRLLPLSTPTYPGIEIGHAFEPAIQVGGDFFDVYVKKNGKLVVSIADASGKGVQACLYSLMLKNMLRTFSEAEEELAKIMQQANNLFCDDTGDTGMFVTVLSLQLDSVTKSLEYNSCGHNPLLYYSANKDKVEFLQARDAAMGVFIKSEISTASCLSLNSGDILVLYSDGVTEAHNENNELFSEERLQRFIQLEIKRSAKELAKGLMEEIKSFAGEAKQHDDITIVILKVQ